MMKLSAISINNGRIKGVNDYPRRGNAPEFFRRVAAAHARGVWLTDELNEQHGTPNPRGVQILAATNIELHRLMGRSQRSAKSTITSCDTCDPSGGGSGDFPVTSFNDSGGNYPYDTEVDFIDGTSMLFEEFTDTGGDQILTSLDSDGTYTEYTYESTFVSAPAPQATMQSCLTTMDGTGVFYIQCGSQNYNPIPKWACPYVAGGGGLLAKWATAAATKNGKAGDAAGAAVGISLNQWCSATALFHRRGLSRAT